ncbi:MAG: N-acetylneuraminate synthase family protein [Candidatus Woesearchaeota archaeon]
MSLANLINNFDPLDNSFQKPFIIAEAGVNHEGKLDLAKRLIYEAKEGGADAIKFQTYKAEKLSVKNSPAYWDLNKEPTTSQFDLFKKYDKFWKTEFEILKKYCDEVGIEFLSTPFDIESATFLNDLMNVFKISSSDLNNLPFIEYICSFKKPIILSTGASFLWEIERTISWIKKYKIRIAILHCVLSYPTVDENANLLSITLLRNRFPDCVIGYSDHTLPKDMKVLEIATLLGARIIEKHFTYDKNLPGNDHYHSMDKYDLMKFIKLIDYLTNVLGNYEKEPLQSEMISRKMARRSLVANRFIPKNKIIEKDDITWKRPGLGLEPIFYKEIIGKRAKIDIPEDTILQSEFFI